MSLVRRDNSPYWYVQFQYEHRTIVRSTKTQDRKLAEKIEAKIRSDVIAGRQFGTRKKITLEESIDKFVLSREGTPNFRNLSSQKKRLLDFFKPQMLASVVESAQLEAFKQFEVGKGFSPQTIKHHIGLLTRSLLMAKQHGYEVGEFVAPKIRLPRHKSRFLSLEEELRLLNELDPFAERPGLAPVDRRSDRMITSLQDNYDLVILLLDTGARYSEVAGLRCDDVNLQAETIRLWRSKVENESILFMTRRVKETLERRLRTKSQFVFSNRFGTKRSYQTAAIRKAFDRAGLHDCTVHTLRHTHASRLIQSGMSVYEVRKVLGHSDIKTTMRYAHLEDFKTAEMARRISDFLQGG